MIWIFCCSSCWPAARRRSRGITDNEMPTRWFSKSDTLQSHGNSLGVEVEGSGFKSQLHSSWLCDLEHAFKSVWDFVKWGCYKTIFYKLTLRMKWDNACGRALENTVLCNISYYLMRHSEELQVETNAEIFHESFPSLFLLLPYLLPKFWILCFHFYMLISTPWKKYTSTVTRGVKCYIYRRPLSLTGFRGWFLSQHHRTK